MRKIISLLFVALTAFSVSSQAHANEFSDLLTELGVARMSIISFVINKNQRSADQQKIINDSANAVSAHLAKMKLLLDSQVTTTLAYPQECEMGKWITSALNDSAQTRHGPCPKGIKAPLQVAMWLRADSRQVPVAKLPAKSEFTELVAIWTAFKKTRETELIPAVLAGKEEKARKLLVGIQQERIAKCQQLVSDLGG